MIIFLLLISAIIAVFVFRDPSYLENEEKEEETEPSSTLDDKSTV